MFILKYLFSIADNSRTISLTHCVHLYLIDFLFVAEIEKKKKNIERLEVFHIQSGFERLRRPLSILYLNALKLEASGS